MKKSFSHIAALLITVSTLVGVAWLVFAVFIDGHLVRIPLTVAGELTTEFETYHPGDIVRAKISYCKNRQLTAVTQWNLVDTYLRIYPEKSSDVGVGCKNVYIDVEPIPMDIYPDLYYFEGEITYEINSLNIIKVPLKTNTFRVVR